MQKFAKIDILVNNAGIIDESFSVIRNLDLQTADRVLDVNVKGTLYVTHAAVKHMGDGGRIINIGSCIGERVPGQGQVAYATSKAAITGLTKALARDLGPEGITVNEVAPGPTDTDMNPEDGPAAAGQKQLLPLGRFAKVAEVADAVAYFASPKAAFTTGTRLGVDGGGNA